MAPGARFPASFLTSLRPEQWSKNAFVFAGLLFGGRLTQGPQYLVAAGEAFAIFCGLSGAVYLLNDVADRTADAGHPLKRRRPIAAGDLSPSAAVIGAAILALACLTAAFATSRGLGLAGTAYLGLLALYSFWLKHVVIMDVLTIAGGFVLRAVAGALAVDVSISPWLLICVTLLALFLGLSKRRHELTSMGIRVTKETLVQQLEMANQMDSLKLPYHQAIMNDKIPLSIGGGIGQSRTVMLLLRKAHLGEVSVTVWPKALKDIGRKKNIFVLE